MDYEDPIDPPPGFMEPSTTPLLADLETPLPNLIAAADHAFEFEHWPDAIALYSRVEERLATTEYPTNGHVYYRVGVMYERGNHVPKNCFIANRYFKQSLHYLTAACDMDPEARCDLAYMFENAYGVEEDKAKAVEYYQIAANLGHPRAQVNLGYMYSNAYGVEQDKAMAVKYYQMAADQGYINAYTNLGYMYSNGYGIQQDKKMAVKYYKKAAKRGYARGLCNLGYMYDYGYGTIRSKAEAAKYYRLAALQGYHVAQCNLAYMYENGVGVHLDKKKAVKLYQLAAEQGYPRALYNLGEMYAQGNQEAGIPLDKRKALQYIVLASDQDYDRAKLALQNILHSSEHELRVIALEYLAGSWPTFPVTKAQTFKNPLVKSYLATIFNGSAGKLLYNIAVLRLSTEWPNERAHAMVHGHCKEAMVELSLVLMDRSVVPKELFFLILKEVICFWPSHYEKGTEIMEE